MAPRQIINRVLILAFVVGPALWLVLSEDGQRRTDLLLLKLLSDRSEISIAFDSLYPDIDEKGLLADRPDIPFRCEERASDFGDRICHAPIAGFNGTPARYVTFFFQGGRLNAMKLAYQHSYHDRVIGELRGNLGEPSVENDGTVYRWRAGGGVLVAASDRTRLGDEPALLWLAMR